MTDTVSSTTAANFIAGEWGPSRSGNTDERRNPGGPSEVVGEFPSSGAEDLADAVDAAQHAARGWARLPAARRGAILTRAAEVIEERAEEIARDMTREMGKPLRESRGEALRAATILRFFGGEGWRPLGQIYAPAPARDRGADHAMELPGGNPGVEDGAGARLRQHRRAQARPGCAADRPAS